MMGRRIALVLMVVVGALAALSVPALAMTVPVVELLEDGAAYSGQEVTVVGELIGDYGFRRDGTMWTQLNSDSYALRPVVEGGPLRGPNIGIGIRMPAEIGRGLDPPGRYRLVGPIVVVTGIWKYHDPDRQGETYLDAQSVVLQAPGRDLAEHPNWAVYAAALALGVIAVVIATVYVHERDSLD